MPSKLLIFVQLSFVLMMVACDSNFQFKPELAQIRESNVDVNEQSWLGIQRRALLNDVWADVNQTLKEPAGDGQNAC